MRVGSLFSGIGGIELGFERAGGFETAWFVEWDAYAQAVLKKNWPGVPIYGDVRSIDWSAVAPVDVLTGGFPCQPHSVAGKRQASADDRDLWPECRRAIVELRPKVCVFENVPGLLTSEKGEFFKRIIDDFYRLGYRPRVYRLSARAVGAPHLRKRVFIVAYPDTGQREQPDETLRAGWDAIDDGSSSLADAQSAGQLQQGQQEDDNGEGRARKGLRLGGCSKVPRDVADSEIERCNNGDDGKLLRQAAREINASSGTSCDFDRMEAGWWAVEPDVGRVAYGVPSRVDRLKCLGNAVVPQVAEVIAKIVRRDLNVIEN